MGKRMRRVKSIISYLLTLAMVIAAMEPMGSVFAADQTEKATASQTVYVGDTTALAMDGAATAVKWATQNAKIADVSKDGTLTAVSEGKTTVTGTTKGKEITYTVAVKNAKLNVQKANVLVGKTVSVKLQGDTVKSVKAADKKIASAKKDGTITGKKVGSTKVTFTGAKGKKYTCSVSVTAGLTQKRIYVTKGQKASLSLAGTNVKKVTSTKQAVAAVSKKGKTSLVIKAKKAGKTNIKVVGKNKKTYLCTVTVEAPKLSAANVTLANGDSSSIQLKKTKQAVSFKSSAESIVKVDAKGKLTSAGVGTAVVTATDASKKTYQCVVKVEDPKMAASKLALVVDQTVALSLSGNTQAVTWSTSNAKAAKVGTDGKVTAIANGSATITAKVKSGRTFRCEVSVEDKKTESSGKTDGKTEDTDSNVEDQKKSGDAVGDQDRKDNGTETTVEEKKDDPDPTSPSGTGEEAGKDDPAGFQDNDDPAKLPDIETEVPVEDNGNCTVSFIDNEGGSQLQSVVVSKGALVGGLPTPVYDEADSRTFLGWYYDPDLSLMAGETDEITETTTLYAKSLQVEQGGVPEVEKMSAIEDAASEYALTVKSSDKTMTAEQALALINVTVDKYENDEELSAKANNIAVAGGNGTFTITGKHVVMEETVDGFEAGGVYVITLPETEEGKEPILTFSGYPDTVREIDLNIAAKEQNNFRMKDDVLMLQYSDISDLKDDEGNALGYIDEPLYTVDQNGNNIEKSDISGSFTLVGKKAADITPGTVLALYEGVDPAEAMSNPEAFSSGEDHLSYVKITKIAGDTFYFQTPNATEVMATPEVLPIPADADLELDDDENTCEIPVSYLDWSDDVYIEAKLDSQTKLDEGDFIAFYKGTYGTDDVELVGDYQKVTKIVEGGTTVGPTGDDLEYVTITTEKSSLAEIADEGQSHTTMDYDIGEDMSTQEIADLKAGVLQQAKESGFAEETALYLSKVALATDKFSTLDHLSDMTKYDIELTDTDGNTYTESEISEKLKSTATESESSPFYEKYKEIIDKYDQKSDVNTVVRKVDVTITSLIVDVSTKAKYLPSGLCITFGEGYDIKIHYPNAQTIDIRVELKLYQEVNVEFGCDGSIEWGVAGIIPYPKDIIISPSVQLGSHTAFDITTEMKDVDREPGTLPKGEQLSDVYTDIATEIQRLMKNDKVENASEAEGISNYITGKYQYLLNQEKKYVNLLNREIKTIRIDIIPPIVQIAIAIYFRVYGDMDLFGFHFSYTNCKKWIAHIHLIKGGTDTETRDVRPSRLEFDVYMMGTLSVRAGIAVEITLNLGLTVNLGFMKKKPKKSDNTSIDFAKAGIGLEVGAYMDMNGIFFYHYLSTQGTKESSYIGATYTDVGMYLRLYLVADIIASTTIAGVDWWELCIHEWTWPIKQFGELDYPINFTMKQNEYKDIKMRQYVKKFAVPDAYYRIDAQNLVTGKIQSKTFETTDNKFDNSKYEVKLSNSAWAYDEENHIVYLKDGFDGMESECDMTLIFKGYYPLSKTLMSRKIHISWDNYLDGYAITPYSNGGSYVEAIVGAYNAAITKPADPTRKGYVFGGWYTDEDCTKKYTFPQKMPDKNTDIYAKWNPATDTPYTVEYYLAEAGGSGNYQLNSYEEFKGTTDSKITVTAKDIEGYVTPANAEIKKLKADGSSVVRFYYEQKQGTYTFKELTAGNADNSMDLTYYVNQSITAPEVSSSGYTLTGWKNEKTGKVITVEQIAENGGVLETSDGENCTYTAQWKERDDVLYRVEYYIQQPSGSYSVQAVSYGNGKVNEELKKADLRKAIVKAIITDENGETSEEFGVADELFNKDVNGTKIVEFEDMTVDGQSTDTAKVKADGSTVIKLKYKRKSYTVTLKGSGEDDQSGVYTDYKVYYGGKMALPIPEKEGYTFKGYVDENKKAVLVNSKTGFAVVDVTKDATYTSTGWTANTYTVTYDANGGKLNGSSSAKFTYDVEQELAKAPTRDGYVFKGWKNTATEKVYDAEESVKNLTLVRSDKITMSAQWELEGYDITYDLDGGSIEDGANPTSYVVSEADKALAYPARTGYTFNGWYNGTEKITSIPGGKSGDLALKASWTAKGDSAYVVNHYQTDLDGKGKTLVLHESLTGTAGTEVTPAVKNFEGFTAPQAETVKIQADGSTVVEYVYTRNSYKLSLDYNGGNADGKETAEETFLYGQNLEVALPTKEGSVFDGWTVNGSTFTKGTMPAEDTALTAAWKTDDAVCEVNHYLMDLNGEYTILAEREYIHGEDGEVITAQPKTYEGFVSPGAAAVTVRKGVVESIDLCYDRMKYDVSWEIGDGTAVNEYTEGKVYYGQAVIAPILTKTGYSYTWDVKPQGVMGTEDQAYKAIWEADQISITFDAMGGTLTGDAARTLTYGKAYGEFPEVTKKNTEFLGWFDDKTGGKELTAETIVDTTKDHIVYARWNNVSADIIYKGIEEGDTNDNPDSYAIGESVTIKAPVRKGYTFLGWTDGKSTTKHKTYTISEDSEEDVILTANWQMDKYTLILYSYSGLYLSKKFAYNASLEKVSLPKYAGYSLTGWKDMETGETYEEIPKTMPAKNLTLMSEWEKSTYHLIVKNPYDAQIEEMGYDIGDNSFIVAPPTKNRTGYDFAGWYLDETYSEDKIMEHFTPVAYNVTIYAKWVPRIYKINFYGNGGKLSDGKTNYGVEYTYDQDKALSIPENYTRKGYTFSGWALTTAGSIAYYDGAIAGKGNNLSTGDEIVNLYAAWTPDVYNITYIVGNGAGDQSKSGNPTSYTIESEGGELEDPDNIVAGYEFKDWYYDTNNNGRADENDTKVTNIALKGETGDKKLYARWAHAGTYSIALKSSTSASPTGNGTTTFTITRKIPAGVEVSTDPQRIYYRTVNGTAIGGTADAINFYHVGGQNVFAVFSDKECYTMLKNEKTGLYDIKKAGTINSSDNSAVVEFDVTKENIKTRYYGDETPRETNGVFAQLFNLSGTNTRYYTVELYRLTSTQGEATGIIDSSKKEAVRNMTMPSGYVLSSSSIYGDKTKTVDHSTTFNNDSGCNSAKGPLDISDMVGFDLCYYLQQAGATAKLGIDVHVSSADEDSTTWSNQYYLKYKLGDAWYNNTDLPVDEDKSNRWYYVTTKSVTWKNFAVGKVYYYGDTGDKGAGGTKYTVTKHKFTLSLADTAKLSQVGIAPAATTDYKKGDTVKFSVIYNELISDYSNVSVNTSSLTTYMPVTNVKCTGGKGTNVLTFEGTASSDFSNTTENGTGTNEQLMKIKPVSGTVKDAKGNS